VTDIESRDVVFLEKDFPMTGEVNKVFELYEMANLDYGATSHSVEDLEATLNPPGNSGHDFCLFLLSCSKITSNINLVEAFVNQFLVINLRLRGKRSWLLYKIMNNQKYSVMLCLVLKQENDLNL